MTEQAARRPLRHPGSKRSRRYDAAMQSWPEWWGYEVVISPHVMERMQERGFSEVDLRVMLDDAVGFRPSLVPGRFLIEAPHGSRT